MDLEAICDHLRAARLAIGQEHSLADRIKTVERHLTPGDALWRDDAVSAETDLLAILAELEQLPKVAPDAKGSNKPAEAAIPTGVNAAIEEIGAALEFL